MSDTRKSTALLIIGAVLVLAFVVGMWFFSKSKTAAPPSGPTPTPLVSRTPAIPANAPPGAEPPNQAGSPTATVTLEEFADYQCPACAVKHPVMDEIKTFYGNRIRFIFHNNPLPQHDKSNDAAVAAEAASLQGKFWEMHDLLFAKQAEWTVSPTYKDVWKGFAKSIGLDVGKWEADIAGTAAKQRVEADVDRARASKSTSTPSLYINGVPVPFAEMDVENLKRLIDAELQKTAP